MSAPTITVKLDNGTGTFPTDITTKVRLPDGVTISGYGRGDEFTQTQPSTLTLTLDNADGHFTDGTVTLVPNSTLIRYTETSGATTVNQFTGRVVTLDLGWPAGGQEFATVQVTASDPLADLSRRTMRSMLEQEILLDSPTAYYTLGEAQGSTSAGDTSGSGNPPLAIAGSGNAVVFGSTGVTGDLTAATFASGQRLQLTLPSGFIPSSGAFAFECFFSTLMAGSTTSPPYALFIRESNGTQQAINLGVASGGVPFIGSGPVGVFGANAINDGAFHHFVGSVSAAGALTAYVDGVLVGTIGGATPTNVGDILGVGDDPGLPGLVNEFTGTVAHVAIYSHTLSAARVAAHAAVLTSFAETADARLFRIASYAGLTATTTSPSGQIMGEQATSGQSFFDAMQTVALAEGGVLYADGTGALQMQGRYYRGQRTTTDLTVTSDAVDPGTSVTWDTQQLVNQVTVTRTGGATQVVGAPAGAVFPQSLELDVDTDESALGAAQWVVASHSSTAPRLSSATIDLLAPPAGLTAASIIALDLGKRLSITPMPSQVWSGTTEFTIEGWSRTLTHDSWSVTYNLLPWSLFEVFILDDTTYGLLDSSVPIGY